MTKHINATHYDHIPAFPGKDRDDVVHGVIETVKGSPHKYALKTEYGIIALKEVLPKGLHWPYDYGFIPQTLGEDEDPLDLLFLSEEGMFSGCMVEARILGSIKLKKNGIENDRFIGAPLRMPGRKQRTDDYDDIADLPHAELDAICRFLEEYSEREGNVIELIGPVQASEAMKSLREGQKKFKKAQK
jgi:inorganic pyrophosphatase